MSRNHLDKSSKSNQRKSDRRYSEQKHGNQELPLVGDIIQCSSSAIAASNLEGNMTYVNPSFLKIWGLMMPRKIWEAFLAVLVGDAIFAVRSLRKKVSVVSMVQHASALPAKRNWKKDLQDI